MVSNAIVVGSSGAVPVAPEQKKNVGSMPVQGKHGIVTTCLIGLLKDVANIISYIVIIPLKILGAIIFIPLLLLAKLAVVFVPEKDDHISYDSIPRNKHVRQSFMDRFNSDEPPKPPEFSKSYEFPKPPEPPLYVDPVGLD